MGSNVMNFLIDTCIWLRAALQPATLPVELRELLSRRGEEFGLAAISVWEVGRKHQLGKLKLHMALRDWLRGALSAHIHLLPLGEEVVSDAMALPAFPTRDPADELIVATARVHKLTLLTTDTKLKAYAHARIRYFTPLTKPRT
jgi:PIN domain nuclease of toxin-antitoxin system